MVFDKIILGAGLYGLYAAEQCGRMGQKVLVLERDPGPFMRATYINQARVHMGYHYPRSYSTAIKLAVSIIIPKVSLLLRSSLQRVNPSIPGIEISSKAIAKHSKSLS